MKSMNILNLGAGVQSTALYLMSMRQDEPDLVPLFDFAIFADTQEEPRAVYDHIKWLKGLGGGSDRYWDRRETRGRPDRWREFNRSEIRLDTVLHQG
jgi:hypothetical protein